MSTDLNNKPTKQQSWATGREQLDLILYGVLSL
jgi:hypothetical protein